MKVTVRNPLAADRWLPSTEGCGHAATDDKGNRLCCVGCNPTVFTPTPSLARGYAISKITNTLLEAKRLYYGDGTSPLDDRQYDGLEGSLTALVGGKGRKPVLRMVGYDETYAVKEKV